MYVVNNLWFHNVSIEPRSVVNAVARHSTTTNNSYFDEDFEVEMAAPLSVEDIEREQEITYTSQRSEKW